MIGIHINKNDFYKDEHHNYFTQFLSYKITLSYHDVEKQVFINDSNTEILIDGWIFNAESYSSQATFVLNMYHQEGIEMVQNLNGQFNILIIDRQKNKLLFINDIFSFRKHFINQQDFTISSYIPSLLNNDTRYNYKHIKQNINYPRFYNPHETFFCNIFPIYRKSIIDITSQKIQNYSYNKKPSVIYKSKDDLQKIINAFQRNAREVHKEHRVMVSLSGGLDSRVLLEHLKNSGLNTEALTYGVRFSDEVRIAEEVAFLNNTPFHLIELNAKDFIENSGRYMYETGGLDIFTQSYVYKLKDELLRRRLKNMVIDTGFALDAFLGGTQAANMNGGKCLNLNTELFDFSNNDSFSTDIRVFSALAYRQSMIREIIEDRYSFYHYDNYHIMCSIPVETIKEYGFYYDFAKNIISRSTDTPLQNTMFGLNLPPQHWKEAAESLSHRDKYVLNYYRKYQKTLYHNRYYSDFDMWLRDNNEWKSALLELSESRFIKELINIEPKKIIEEHLLAKKSHMRILIKLISINQFNKAYSSNNSLK